MNKIPLDILTANISNDWQDHFLWPVNSIKVLKIRKDIESILFSILESLENFHDQNILKTIFNLLVRENLSLINALLVIQGFEKINFHMDVSCQADWSSLFKGIIGKNYLNLKPLFLPNVQEANFTRSIKKLIKNNYKYLFKIKNSDEILLFAAEDIAIEISQRKGSRCFRYLDQSDINLNKKYFHKEKSNIELALRISSSIINYIAEKKITITDSLMNYVSNYHRNFIMRTSDLLLNLERSGKLKNKEVWAVSGHNYFNRLIAIEVNRRGGKISNHEHGEPKAFYNSSVHGYGELGLCDRFVTYTSACADLYEKSFDLSRFLKKKKPQIDVSLVGSGAYYSNLIQKSHRNKIKIRNREILYVSGGFNNDAIFLGYRPHDMVYYEWQGWLFNILRELKYNITVKYHPEALLKGRELKVPANIKVVQGLFQDHIENDYILLFDNPCSTAFKIALATSLPIVFINNKVSEMFASVLEDLKSRAEIVEGFYDERNRFRVNPTDLLAAIEGSGGSKNYDFVNKYIVTNAAN